MIPKTIHYCWFGGKPLPELAGKCIESWRKYLPEYEIKEWNESNFNVNACDYAREAYEAGKWAFVSDYARFWILYRYGGVYFDTDVELIRPIDDLIATGSFIGCEHPNPDFGRNGNRIKTEANPGLGLAAAPGLGLYKDILDDYEKDHFIMPEKGGPVTIVQRMTAFLLKHGLECVDCQKKGIDGGSRIYKSAGIYIYPPEYFCPMDYWTGIVTFTDNTRSIHHYTASWLNEREKKIQKIKQRYAARGQAGCTAEWLHTLPLRVRNKMDRLGFWGTIKFVLNSLSDRGGV